MVQTPAKTLTLEEFLQLPETEPASEYIDGEIIQKPMPQGKHSAIQSEFASAVNAALRTKKIARAFPELRCQFAGWGIVPDVSVFTWARIPRQADGSIANVFQSAPDWLIEILSPDQNSTKITKKILHALKYETQMGWLIDPEEKTIFVYRPGQQPEVFDEPEQQLPLPEFAQELNLTVGLVFDWLLD
ncbi:Uma2 family endonuclease [[Phormidium] sp. ETS-05]|uniref:Uma2 family endonuclease n=1 Tax=[Phormidium] sp. ETS-05 TaxID=222819 RepID=UPI0018EED3D3|nr:Uma2 family endonuclease [[Phormidium] sp. ETS-05]